MKIVHVCINSNMFGKDYAYQDNLLSKAHRKLGHEVSIIAPTYSGFDPSSGRTTFSPPGMECIGDSIKVYRLKPALPWAINHTVHCFHGLGKIIKSISPDFIFVHGVTSFNYRFFSSYKKKHPQVRIVYDNHGDFNNSCHNRLSYLYLRYFVRNVVIRKIVNTSTHFYGVTPARCDFLHDVYGVPKDRIYLLPMGADDDDMNIGQKDKIREEVRCQYKIKKEDFLIVTGGKIDPLKNIHVLAEAVAKSEYKNIKILIFGSIREDLKDVFKNLQSERIQCIGWIPSNVVYRYFYAADMVMFPGLHSVLWEQAVASQVPCAFSRIKGFEHVDIGGNCVLMDGKTADYYQSLIEKIFCDKDYYASLYMNAHTEKSRQFLYSHIAQKVLDDVKE